jgi:hypothetical protein
LRVDSPKTGSGALHVLPACSIEFMVSITSGLFEMKPTNETLRIAEWSSASRMMRTASDARTRTTLSSNPGHHPVRAGLAYPHSSEGFTLRRVVP